MSQTDRAQWTVPRWERIQARSSFLLPIIRALELGLVALVGAITLFYANANGGFLLSAARAVWGSPQTPGALFAPTFGAMALMLGFAAGPYVDAARVIRRESAELAAVAQSGLIYLLANDAGFKSGTPVSVKNSLRSVVAKSHDYVAANSFDPQDDRALAQHTRRLAHYWDKRSGAATITVDNVAISKRYSHVKLAIAKLAILAGLVAATICAFIWQAANFGITALPVLLSGSMILLFEWRIKKIVMPYRVL